MVAGQIVEAKATTSYMLSSQIRDRSWVYILATDLENIQPPMDHSIKTKKSEFRTSA